MTFGGIDFIGTTLWFKQMPDYQRYAPLLNDFRVIQGFVPKVFEENKDAIDFLNWHVNDNSIVITHHSPTFHSTPMRFKEEPVNMFFTCDMEILIKERKPKLWIHGHTHHSFNYMLHNTHIICNPLGYVGHEVNQEFISNMMIDYDG
jgi:Icc-related predicted phosphoesterase